MIDLHLHTDASDGRLSPVDLARAAHAAGLSTIAVTDHDTMSAVPAVAAEARLLGLEVVPGIEITAVHAGRDVHVLGYFLDDGHGELAAFLARQRADRRRRVDDVLDRLAALGAPLARPLPGETADAANSVGRPLVARALVEAGHAADIADAFDRFLSEGRPAFVPRRGASPADVVQQIGRAGGLASLAHPGIDRMDDLIPTMIDAGLAAIEVFHPEHSAEDVERYQRIARDRRLAMTGGSDYHGPGGGREKYLGRITLPAAEYAALVARRAGRARA